MTHDWRPDALVRLLGRIGIVAGSTGLVVALFAVGSSAQDGPTTTASDSTSTSTTSSTTTTTTLPEPPAPVDGVGLVDPSEGAWWLRDPGSGETTSFYFGNPGDLPFMGDWDCDGVDTPGLYRQADGYVYLRNSNSQGVADVSFFFGDPGDVPLAGDFDGDGCDTVSIYRPSEGRFHVIDRLGEGDGGLGAAEVSYLFGDVGDVPFVGDFDGDAIDTFGLHRESIGFAYFRNSHSQGNADVSFFYGDRGDQIFAGHWTGSPPGTDTVGIFRRHQGAMYLSYQNATGSADEDFDYGAYRMRAVPGDFGELPGGAPAPPRDQFVAGEFTTYHPCCESRVTNIHLIADAVDGAVVLPGEEFSVNAHVGQRTEAKGYVRAGAIIDGKLYCCDNPANIGGGTSQFGTTFYNAVFFGGYEEVAHRPHSLYFTRYPMGREATLGYPTPDVIFRNDTRTPVTIDTSYTNTSVTVRLIGNNEGRVVYAGTSGGATSRDGGRVTTTRTIVYPSGAQTTESWTNTYKRRTDLDPPEPSAPPSQDLPPGGTCMAPIC